MSSHYFRHQILACSFSVNKHVTGNRWNVYPCTSYFKQFTTGSWVQQQAPQIVQFMPSLLVADISSCSKTQISTLHVPMRRSLAMASTDLFWRWHCQTVHNWRLPLSFKHFGVTMSDSITLCNHLVVVQNASRGCTRLRVGCKVH